MENTANSSTVVSEPVENEEIVESSEETQADSGESSEVTTASVEKDSSKPVQKEAKKTAELKKELKKLKIKFNGKEEDVEFDPSDDDYLAKQFQLAKLGQSKAQDYSKLEKEVGQFIELLKKDPRAILTDPEFGVDFKKLVNDYIEEELNNSKKSPELLEKERLEKELKTIKEQQKKRDEEFQAKEFERMQELAYQQYDHQINDALTSANIPKNAYTIKKIADYMLLGVKNGLDVTPSDVLPLVQEEIRSDIKEMFGIMPDEMIEQMVGKDTIGRLRKKSVAKAKQAPQTASKLKDIGKVSKEEAKPTKKTTIRELWGV